MSTMLERQAREVGGGDGEASFARLLTSYPRRDKVRFVMPERVAELVFCLAGPRPH